MHLRACGFTRLTAPHDRAAKGRRDGPAPDVQVRKAAGEGEGEVSAGKTEVQGGSVANAQGGSWVPVSLL